MGHDGHWQRQSASGADHKLELLSGAMHMHMNKRIKSAMQAGAWWASSQKAELYSHSKAEERHQKKGTRQSPVSPLGMPA